jgi:peroxiredoxin
LLSFQSARRPAYNNPGYIHAIIAANRFFSTSILFNNEAELPFSAKACVALGSVLLALAARPSRAAEPEVPQIETGGDAVRAELNQLGLEYKRLAQAQALATPADETQKSDEQLSDEQWLKQERAAEANAPDPDSELLPRFLEFAKRHPDSPFALDALAFVIYRGGPETGDVYGKAWQTKELAIDLVLAQHMTDPRVAHVLESLGGSIPSPKTEAFLKQAFENSPDRNVQAAAEFGLARYYQTLNDAYKRSQEIQAKPHPLNYERFRKLVVTPYLENSFPLDRNKNSAEVNRLLNHVVEHYGDVSAIDWKTSGPAPVFLEAVPYSKPKTYGDLAKSMLFELNNILPGKKAPDIEGTDADGKHFRLSDYQGQVVLLTFSADWCGGCVELYPLERNLIKVFHEQPFVILSVSRDERIDTLKSSSKSGAITWRCWWDGMDGPICTAWNCHGIPNLYLLDDQQIIQDTGLNRYSSPEEFEKAIAALLQNIPAKKTPSE